MSLSDKVNNQVQETVGEVIGNSNLKAEGKADRSEAGLRQVAQDLKDHVATTKDAVRKALDLR
ncbi:CsbD family protein [Kribbella sp. NBC_01505]|uniref:CsbD family protein n=1 Tax=Kribbella sp. NBC_01505 TaxID=2903580 RepID=UPI00386F5EA6